MRNFLLAFTPDDITSMAKMIVVYLIAIASAAVTLATALLRFMNWATPVVEGIYAREGAGEWRPKFWARWDKTVWFFQRVSGAGHLTRQTTIHEVRRSAARIKGLPPIKGDKLK